MAAVSLPRLALFLAASWHVEATQDSSGLSTITVYSEKISLRPGEVFNAWTTPQALPKDFVAQFANTTMHMKEFQLDIVRRDPVTGEEQPLPLDAIYNHHHALLAGPMDQLQSFYNNSKGVDPLRPFQPEDVSSAHRGHSGSGCVMSGVHLRKLLRKMNKYSDEPLIAQFGGASGAEYRHTSTALPYPYTTATSGPEAYMGLIHFINMQGSGHQRFFQCPCTSARKINVANGTIDGLVPLEFECSDDLLRQKNSGCSLASYKGGYRCCEHGVFLSEEQPAPDAPVQEFFAKYTLKYYDTIKGAVPVEQTDCCDATGDLTKLGNIEFDVPQCDPDTPREFCEYTVTSVQKFNVVNGTDPDEEMELVHAWGHQHVGGISMELYNEETGQLLCRTRPTYGSGTSPGDEAGFIVGIPPCVWGPPPLASPPRLRRSNLLRTVSRYNSTVERTGVMGLWLMNAAPIPAGRRGLFV